PRFRRKSAPDSVSYLVAIDLCRSADRHHDVAHRGHVQNGRLRFFAHPFADFPGPNALDAHAAALAGGRYHYFFGWRGLRPTRPETRACLLLHHSPRLL